MGEHIKAVAWLVVVVVASSLLAAQTLTVYGARAKRGLPPSEQFISAHQVYLEHQREWNVDVKPGVRAVASAERVR